jgi:cytochrome c oxidase assembly factor CtaG
MTDQQLGAIIMKVGGALIFISLIIDTFFKWYSSEEKKHQLS